MKPHYKAIGSYGTLGIEIALCIILGAGGGYWLDGKFKTEPVLMVLGFFFGLGAAGKAVHQAWTQMQKREEGNPVPRWDRREDTKEKAGDDRRVREDDHGQE